MANNRQQSFLLTGAHIIAFVNASPFARVSSISLSLDSPKKKLHCIDTPLPVELIPLTLDVSGTMTVFKLKKDLGLEGVGMVPTWANYNFGKYFDLAILDRSTDSIIFHLLDCSVEGQRWNMTTKGYLIGNVNFSGLYYNNDLG
jgi:hypothetical protein